MALLAAGGCALRPPASEAERIDAGLKRIEHIVVIYAENRSFDNLYGLFPGADGIANARPEQTVQVDRDGRPLPHLPPVWLPGKAEADPAYPAALPNAPFRIDAPPVNRPLSVPTRDLIHAFYRNQEQIDGGRMDRFAAVSDAGGLVMGYYDGQSLPMWKWAQEYTLADRFFMAAFGGSFLNHLWLACACTPVWTDAPAAMRAKLMADGRLERAHDSPASALAGPPKVGASTVTPDGYVVNTAQPRYQPSGVAPLPGGDARYADPAKTVPPQTQPTLGDRLSDKGVSWAWYSGAWNAALADGAKPLAERRVIYKSAGSAPNFQAHHQPYNYFARYAPGTAERAAHLKDEADFVAAIDAGSLPAVAFYKPQGKLNQHPGYADVLSGDAHVAALVERIRKSPAWSGTAIIVTYDENGGFWDHVPPPKGDRWGPAVRIPAIVISPYARRGFVDHTPYDTTSVLKLITRRFGLEPLPGVRAQAGDLTNAFEF